MYFYNIMFVQAISKSQRRYSFTCTPIFIGITLRHFHSCFPTISRKITKACISHQLSVMPRGFPPVLSTREHPLGWVYERRHIMSQARRDMFSQGRSSFGVARTNSVLLTESLNGRPASSVYSHDPVELNDDFLCVVLAAVQGTLPVCE
jgi:hypothetical protein